MRRVISVVGTVLVMLLLTVGCSSQTNPQPQNQQAPQTIPQPTQENADLGKKVFDYNCAGCHSTDSTKGVGPGLKGIYSKDKLTNGKPVNDVNIGELIKSGAGRMPGNTSLSEGDLVNLTAYLKTLK